MSVPSVTICEFLKQKGLSNLRLSRPLIFERRRREKKREEERRRERRGAAAQAISQVSRHKTSEDMNAKTFGTLTRGGASGASKVRGKGGKLPLSCASRSDHHSDPKSSASKKKASTTIERSHAASLVASRRLILSLAGSMGAGSALTLPAFAGQFTGRKTWNGEAGTGQCPLGEEGEECRLQGIINDSENFKASVTGKSANAPTSTASQAAPKINDDYFKLTEALIQEIDAYLQLDVFDKQRRTATSDIQLNVSSSLSFFCFCFDLLTQSFLFFFLNIHRGRHGSQSMLQGVALRRSPHRRYM